MVLGRADDLDRLRELYAAWPLFTTLINNAQQEMARARLGIAAVYDHALAGGDEPFHGQIESEFAAAREAVLHITGQRDLLDNNRVIQALIDRRNPGTDALNLLQIELLRRVAEREAVGQEPDAELLDAVLLSLNAIAAAMQSTG